MTERLSEAHEFRAMLDRLEIGVASIAAGGALRYTNARLSAWFPGAWERVDTAPLPETTRSDLGAALAALSGGAALQRIDFVAGDQARQRHYASTLRPDAAGGAIWEVQDVSPQRQLERTLRERATRFDAFMRHSPTVAWLKDTQGRYLYASAAFERTFGLAPEAWRGRCDQDFLPREFAEQCRHAERIVQETQRAHSAVGPAPSADGEPRTWFLIRFPITDEHGAQLVGGIATDITERQHLERELRETQAQLRSLVDESPVIVWIKDAQCRYTYASRSFERQMNLESQQIIGTTDAQWWPADVAQRFHDNDRLVLETGRTCDFIESAAGRDGVLRFWWVMKYRFENDQGERFVGGVGVDITERKRVEEQLKLQTLTDELTGVYNRRGLHELGEQELHMLRRYQRPAALFFVDIDDLKLINDTHGHGAGDEAIICASETLRLCFRNGDIIARVGGDEFAVLAVQCGEPAAIEHRIERCVADFNRSATYPWRLALSVGHVPLDINSTESFESLLRQADAGMYAAKSRRRGEPLQPEPLKPSSDG